MKSVFTHAVFAAATCLVLNVSPCMAESSELHKVRSGDTLWDLSGNYLQDPLLWPRIWKMNPEIRNPHKISPGQIVKIPLPGEKVSTTKSQEVEAATPAPPVPPRASEPPLPAAAQAGRSAPDLSALPLGLRLVDETVQAVAGATPGADQAGGGPHYDRGIGMVTDTIPADGRVVHTEENWSSAASGNRIYVEAPGARVGQRFGIYRDLGKVKFPQSRWTWSLGHLLADIGILEIVSIDKGKQVGLVTRAYAEAQQGDLLGPVMKVPVVTARSREGAPVPISGNVIAIHFGRVAAGPDDIVYINLGRRDGIVPGDRLFLGGPKDAMVKREAGEILILSVTPTTAAALVLPESGHGVQIGDAVGPLR